jgi:asparagine synthase (glutamine-hydrolysing)
MCGIAGAIGWIDKGIEAAITRMSGAMRHRGPDDEGTWRSIERPVSSRAGGELRASRPPAAPATATAMAAPPRAETPPAGTGVLPAFRRLAIIGRSADVHQLMIDENAGNVIAFNGEVYYFMELRRELERGGAAFRSRSDTEVVLRAYGRWGMDSIRRRWRASRGTDSWWCRVPSSRACASLPRARSRRSMLPRISV